MLFLALQYAKKNGKSPVIAAVRNAHKTFVTAAALLDFDIEWIMPDENSGYLSCSFDFEAAERIIAEKSPAAFYVTTPDYLGGMADIRRISALCKKHGVLLLVDNAHGAYLRFLPESCHPIDLGADICCDSAHKTLPVLTGGAYLHVSQSAPDFFLNESKKALSLFGSTSPSYLIMQSLDAANAYLADGFREKLARFIPGVDEFKAKLGLLGFSLCSDELLKITLMPKSYGYTGIALAGILRKNGIECEFSDPDYIVFMLSAERGKEALERLFDALSATEKREPIIGKAPVNTLPEKVMSVREAVFSVSETVPVSQSEGRILASLNVGCPPAVPVVVSGERISEDSVKMFEYYGITECEVVK